MLPPAAIWRRSPCTLPGSGWAYEHHGVGEIVDVDPGRIRIRFAGGIVTVAVDAFGPSGFVMLGHRLHRAGRRGTVVVMVDEFYWCVEHDRVESGDGRCPRRNLLGPYPDRASAARALDMVRRRNEIADAADKRWE